MTIPEIMDLMPWLICALLALFFGLVWFFTCDDIDEACFGSCENCFNEHCDGCPNRRID